MSVEQHLVFLNSERGRLEAWMGQQSATPRDDELTIDTSAIRMRAW